MQPECFYSWFDELILNFVRCPISVVVKGITIGAEGRGSIPGPVKSDTMSSTARRRFDVFMCCQALCRGDGPRHSLPASA